MKKEFTIRIHMTQGVAHGLMIALAIVAFPAYVDSESVTLQTYYPAPYGYFTQARTADKTTLAENGTAAGGSFVGIGTTGQSGTEKLRVVGGTTRMEGGLTVTTGGAAITGTSSVAGGDFSVTGGNGYVSGYMGVGVAGSATWKLNVAGKARIANIMYLEAGGYCWQSTGGSCGGSNFAAWAPGLKTQGYWFNNLPTVDANLAPGETVTTNIGIQFYCCTS